MKAERLAHEIETRAVPFDEHELRVSLAFGHYTFHGEEDIAAALEAADRAMYAHKKGDGAA
jgi:GGDEF domain-containing protein